MEMKKRSNSKAHLKVLKLAFMQLGPSFSKRNALEDVCYFAQKLPQNIDCLLLPEVWSVYNEHFNTKMEEVLFHEWAFNILKKLAVERQINILGSTLMKQGAKFSNTAFWIAKTGKVLHQYSKVHLFRQGDEHIKFVSGNKLTVFKTQFGKSAFAICYDIRFPEFIRNLVLKGAQLLWVPAAWPAERIEHFQTLLRARAIENQCVVIACNKVGPNQKGVINGGNSVVYNAWGDCLLKMNHKPGVAYVEIDLNHTQGVREKFPVLKMRRPGVYFKL